MIVMYRGSDALRFLMSVQSSRTRVLNEAESRRSGRYVLYWMQQSQRARFNPALELAIDEANARDLPVLVCFGLMDGYPEARYRRMLVTVGVRRKRLELVG